VIRQATRHDKQQIIEMMKEFRDAAGIPELAEANDENYFNTLLDGMIAGQGVIYISEDKGLIMGLVLPSIWDNKILGLHEIAWYVRPEYRGSTVGFRLLDAYLKHAQDMKRSGRVKYLTISKMDNSPDLKYQRYGFRKKDENWIQ
jgi:N-acetylglutamate synthase-like GNAT family acetyltransferase